MCGIAGWFDKNTNLHDKETVIVSMSENMKRRGPDDSGIFLQKNICFMHRRLAVIDVENGKQPMTKSHNGKTCHIVYNGELYNTAEIRQELRLHNYSFATHSDTEVVLAAYMRWGADCVYKLNGIFAFAIWDEDEQSLFIARDRIGVKPFFYYPYNGGLLFASEIKTLLANPLVEPCIDEIGMYELFLIGPGRTLGQGVIKGVEELLPGECAIYKNDTLRKYRYFTVRAEEHTESPEETIKTVRNLLTDAIERQLVTDVPLCFFLSGGLDSSIICYVASEYNKRHGLPPIDTYSVDYTDNAKYFQKSIFQPTPDSDFISIMTDALKSQHHNIELSNKDLYYALYPAVEARSLPGMTDVDSSLLLFCQHIKREFKVALSGECADELFGGYPWYHNREILFEDTFPWSRSTDIRRQILKDGFLPKGDDYVRQRYLDTCRNTDTLPSDLPEEKRMREMFMLNFNWFMQTLLDRKDRMSMYNGLEVRVPFCDYRIVQYAYNIPWHIKALNGREKGIVRAAFRGLLPDSIIERKKSPYPKTHNPLYFELVSSRVREILEDKNSVLASFLNRSGIEQIIENPNSISSPWYGQLMKAPQILAYIVQLDYWFKSQKVKILF
ncbi:MAG: asparagine synthase (glutamine-hydrolyzing) [Acutalibacteraceae bacterium]